MDARVDYRLFVPGNYTDNANYMQQDSSEPPDRHQDIWKQDFYLPFSDPSDDLFDWNTFQSDQTQHGNPRLLSFESHGIAGENRVPEQRDVINHVSNDVVEPQEAELSLNSLRDALAQPESTERTTYLDGELTNVRSSKRNRERQNEDVLSRTSSSEHPLESKDEARKKRRTMRLSKKQTGILESWLSDNIANPYPEKAEKTKLAKATGLLVRQVESWFSRTRQRKLAHPCAAAGDRSKPFLQPNASRSSDICFSLLQLSWETAPNSQKGSDENVSLISFQRNATTKSKRPNRAAAKVREWLKALPQSFDEVDVSTNEQQISPLSSTASLALSRSSTDSKSINPVILPDSPQPVLLQPTTDSFRLLDNMHIPPLNCGYAYPDDVSSPDVATYPDDVMSNKSAHSGKGTRSPGSVHSAGTLGSACSYTSFGRRKGRRRTGGKSASGWEDKTGITYTCSFCDSQFTVRYTWRRHEVSIHLPQEVWVCGASDPNRTSDRVCPVCPEHVDHTLCKHQNWESCWEKPERDRTFTRKDGFVQHLRNVHKLTLVETWKFPGKPWALDPREVCVYTCQYCGFWSATWTERVDHVARHFERRHQIDITVKLASPRYF